MKNTIFTLVFFSLFDLAASAQSPQAFKYQAVVRNAVGQVLANQNVGLEIRLSTADMSTILYKERHTATTNDFGLVNLNVGSGVVQYGKFDTLHWEQSAIYINLWLDVTGGTNYQYMGRSQLLSVPYALYAANAANVTGGNGLPDDAQKGDILYHDGSAWQSLAAGAPGTVLTMDPFGLPTWTVPPSPLDCLHCLLKVTMTNGEVLYVYPTNILLIAFWGHLLDVTSLTNITDVADAQMDFAGEANTAAIIPQFGPNEINPYAAKICNDLVAYGFDDWYLPAAGELNEIYKNLGPTIIGGSGQITGGAFWSSSEYSNSDAWYQQFSAGSIGTASKGSPNIQCRCVRK